MYGIARHHLARYTRKGVIHRRAIERLGIDLPSVSADDHERIIALAGLADLRALVADAFSDLPLEQREALRLRIIDEQEYADVAAALGVSEQTARARVSRALRRIADKIDIPTPAKVTP